MSIIRSIAVSVFAVALWSGVAVYGGLSGWWLTPIAKPGDTEQFYDSMLDLIDEGNKEDIAMVLIEDGEVVKQHFAGVDGQINADTLFPTASLSKWITAYSVMILVEDQLLNLDAPISQYLTRWQLPESEFDNERVTIRQLLSHTSGLGDGLGFGDFQANETMPGLVDSLNNPRSRNGVDGEKVEIKLTSEPGSNWAYSGGGYLIMQLIIEEVSQQRYSEFVSERVFKPLTITRSNFAFLGDHTNRTEFYDNNLSKTPIVNYQASGATGLSSTANDLTQFVRANTSKKAKNIVLSGESVRLMQQATGRELGADIWGLGVMLYAPTDSNNYVYGHDGGNEPAINSTVRINPNSGDALIVLVSGNSTLASAIGYHWVLWQTGKPDFLSFKLAIGSAVMPILFGSAVIILLIIIVGFSRRRKGLT